MDELWKFSALELREIIDSKEIKPSELMEAVLRRVEKVNPKLNAFCTLDPDSAVAQARKADDLMARGKAKGLLFGLPVSIKDLIFTRRSKRCDDLSVLKAAAAFEEAKPWRDKWPNIE